jgi:hypothetical protein
MLFGGGKHPPKEKYKKHEEDQEGNHGVVGHPFNSFHMVLYKFQHGYVRL